MKGELPEETLKRLIAIGRQEAFDDLADVITGDPRTSNGQFMREAPEFWFDIGAPLSIDERRHLIRALTIAERDVPSCRAGSVASVIWLFRQLTDDSRSPEHDLVDWILRESINPYLPWGFHNRGARSLNEHREMAALEAKHKREKHEREMIKRREAELEGLDEFHLSETKRAAKAQMEAAKASFSLYNAIRRGDSKAIVALRRKGGDPTKPCGDRTESPLDYARAKGDPDIIALLAGPIPEDVGR